jgi:hypothetical protein
MANTAIKNTDFSDLTFTEGAYDSIYKNGFLVTHQTDAGKEWLKRYNQNLSTDQKFITNSLVDRAIDNALNCQLTICKVYIIPIKK